MFICPVLSSLFANRSNLVIVHISIEFRNALVNMIFRKSLRLSPAYRQQQSTGKIINMFSNDTKQVQNFLNFANNVAIAPLQIIITLYLIYREVGVATFAGLGYMIIIAPLNSVVFGYLSKIRLKKVAETDKRVKLMNEILSGIVSIFMLCIIYCIFLQGEIKQKEKLRMSSEGSLNMLETRPLIL